MVEYGTLVVVMYGGPLSTLKEELCFQFLPDISKLFSRSEMPEMLICTVCLLLHFTWFLERSFRCYDEYELEPKRQGFPALGEA